MKQFTEILKVTTTLACKELQDSEISKTIIFPYVDKSVYTSYITKIYNIHKALELSLFEAVGSVIQDVDLRVKTMKL